MRRMAEYLMGERRFGKYLRHSPHTSIINNMGLMI
jgi:hypothetical protein